MLFVEFAEVVVGWLWRNGMIDDMSEVELDWFNKPTMERGKDMMESIADDEGSIAWCG
jgi:hypothetical protein